MKITEAKVIDSSDLDGLIQKTYGRPYCFQQQDGCQMRGTLSVTVPDDDAWDCENDSIPEKVNGSEMGVSFDAWLSRDPKAPVTCDDGERPFMIDLFWERNFFPSQGVVLNDLHEKGLLDAGEYMIVIDW